MAYLVITEPYTGNTSRVEPGKFEYFLVDGLKLPPRVVKPVFDGLYNVTEFIDGYNNYMSHQPLMSKQILEGIDNLTKRIVGKKEIKIKKN